jgi:hypothetical protein
VILEYIRISAVPMTPIKNDFRGVNDTAEIYITHLKSNRLYESVSSFEGKNQQTYFMGKNPHTSILKGP